MKAKDGNAVREQAWLYFEKKTAEEDDTQVGFDCVFCSRVISVIGETFYDVYVRPEYSNYIGTVCESCYAAMKEESDK